MYRCAFDAIIQNKITTARCADDNLFQFAMRVPTMYRIFIGTSNIVDPFNIKREIGSLFQRNQVAGMITTNCEI